MKNVITIKIVVFFLVAISTLTAFLFLSISKDIQKSKSFIGRSVLIKTDTLLIVDYSTYKETYKLSNGLEVNGEYCKQIIIR